MNEKSALIAQLDYNSADALYAITLTDGTRISARRYCECEGVDRLDVQPDHAKAAAAQAEQSAEVERTKIRCGEALYRATKAEESLAAERWAHAATRNAASTAERERDELRQQIAVKDEALRLVLSAFETNACIDWGEIEAALNPKS